MFRLPSRFLAPVARAVPMRGLATAHSKFLVESPYSGEVVAELPLATEAEAAKAVQSAVAAQKEWKGTTLQQRIRVVEGFLAHVDANRDAIARVRACIRVVLRAMDVSKSTGSVFRCRRSRCRWASRCHRLMGRLMA